MSTNPNDIVRVRARANGRASVYEANAWCQSLSQGVLDGNGVIQNTSADMNVLVGGTSSKPDVVIASNPSGYKIALDIVGQQAVAITAPASHKRITSIVAYTDDLSLASTDENITLQLSSKFFLKLGYFSNLNSVSLISCGTNIISVLFILFPLIIQIS